MLLNNLTKHEGQCSISHEFRSLWGIKLLEIVFCNQILGSELDQNQLKSRPKVVNDLSELTEQLILKSK